jgi:hypothetical protein
MRSLLYNMDITHVALSEGELTAFSYQPYICKLNEAKGINFANYVSAEFGAGNGQ